MRNSIGSFLRVPHYDDEYLQRNARYLLYMVTSAFLIITGLILYVQFVSPVYDIFYPAIAVYYFNIIVMLLLIRRKKLYAASLIFSYGGLVRAILNIFGISDGLPYDIESFNFFLALASAGLLLSTRSLFVITSLIITSWTTYFFISVHGLMNTNTLFITNFESLFILSATCLVSSVFLYEFQRRSKTEIELKKSRNMFKAVLDNIPQYVFWKDKNSVYLGCNRNFAKAAGFDEPGDIIGKTDYELAWKQKEADSFIEYDKKVMESGKAEYHIIESQHMANGKEAMVDTNKIPLYDSNDNIAGILGTYEDITERLKSIQELQASEEKYRSLVDNLNIGVFRSLLEGGGLLIHANYELARMLGYDSVEELKEISLSDLYINRDNRKVFVDKIKQDGFVTEYENRLKCKDGTIIHVREQAKAFYSGSGNILWVDGVIQDITHQKFIEEALKESEERLQTIVSTLPVMLFSISVNGTILLNEGLGFSRYNVKPGELTGRHYSEFLAEYPEISENIKRAFNGERFTSTNRLGSRHWETWYSPVFDDNGEVESIICLSRDITKSYRAELALSQSEENYRRLFENASDSIILMELDTGRILEANSSTVKLYNYTYEELMDIRFAELTADLVQADDFFHKLRENGEVSNHEIVHVTKQAIPLDLLINASIIRYSDMDVVMCFNRDVTEHKRLLDQLHRSQKIESLGKMAGAVAHDLNHILTGLVTYPDMLLLDIEENNPLREKIELIKNSGQRAAAIVEDLLIIARGGLSIAEQNDLNDIVREGLNSPEVKALESKHPNIVFDTDIQEETLFISCTRLKTLKVLNNLIFNAIEAMPHGGRIFVSTYLKVLKNTEKRYEDIPPGHYAVLSISDTGIGIRREDLQYIFDPYYTKKVLGKSGSGIGLTVVWNIVKDNEGYFDVKSEAGTGALFSIYFPIVVRDTAREKPRSTIDELLGNGENILLVDDEETQRIIGVDLLTHLNYTSHTATNYDEAVEAVKKQQFDLVLMDIYLGEGRDGIATAKRLKKMQKDLKVMYVSGFPDSDQFKELKKKKGTILLKKPYTIDEIGTAMKDMLKK